MAKMTTQVSAGFARQAPQMPDRNQVAEFIREGDLGRWDAAGRLIGRGAGLARTLHMALAMLRVLQGDGPVIGAGPMGGAGLARLSVPAEIRTPEHTLAQACMEAGISVADCRGRDRAREVSRRRQHVMAIMRGWGKSFPQIGRAMNRHHASIINGIAAHERRLAAAKRAAVLSGRGGAQ